MNQADKADIRAMKLAPGSASTNEEIIAITTLWNDGYSTKHIAEVLGHADHTVAQRAIASVRTKTRVFLRRVAAPGERRNALEHPTWWTPARLALGETLWVAGEIKSRAIADRMGTNDDTVAAKAREMGWVRVTIHPPKVRSQMSNADRMIAAARAPLKGIEYDALPGSEPKPFWKVALKGECNWILGDHRGSMADALTCAAVTDDGAKYCPAHTLIGRSAAAKPKTANQLARSLRRYA